MRANGQRLASRGSVVDAVVLVAGFTFAAVGCVLAGI